MLAIGPKIPPSNMSKSSSRTHACIEGGIFPANIPNCSKSIRIVIIFGLLLMKVCGNTLIGASRCVTSLDDVPVRSLNLEMLSMDEFCYMSLLRWLLMLSSNAVFGQFPPLSKPSRNFPPFNVPFSSIETSHSDQESPSRVTSQRHSQQHRRALFLREATFS